MAGEASEALTRTPPNCLGTHRSLGAVRTPGRSVGRWGAEMSPDAASSAPSRPFRGQSPIAETHIVIAGRRPKPEEAPGLERVQDWQNRGRVGRRRVPGQLL